MNCCERDNCYHSYHSHTPGTARNAALAGLRGKLGPCGISSCRCRGYVKGKSQRPKGVPALCPDCASGTHTHHSRGRRCLSWVDAEPRNWTCTCEIDRDSELDPFVISINAPVTACAEETA